MNILFVCDEFPPGKTGGIGIITEMLGEKLAALGHHIFVVGLCAPGYGGANYEEHSNIKIWRLRYSVDVGIISAKDRLVDKLILHALRKSGILKLDAKIQFNKMFKLIEDLIEKEKIDVVEMPDWNNFFFNIKLKDFQIPVLKVPVIVKMHGSLTSINTARGLAVSNDIFMKENYLYKRADAVCAASNYISNLCKGLHSIEREIKTLYNGVEVGAFYGIEERVNKNRVIFSGSLLYNKGIFSLLKSWPDVLKNMPGATLHIYGKGQTGLAIKMLSEEVAKTVFFYGHVPRSVLLKELKTADLAVFPSYSEAFGLGPVEAMSMGCPVIFTKRSSGPEIIDDMKDGLTVDPDNINEISLAITSVLTDYKLRGRLGLSGYEKVKSKFDINTSCEEHLKYYSGVISSFRKKSGSV